MTLHEKELFMQAKVKELKSFFENGVWEFSTAAEADPSRTLSSRLLLKWSKNPDGSPRAKARLIVRGYADRDALEGKIDTAAPTTSRLSRSMLLSMMATMRWNCWTADVSTAFLQGLPQETTTMGEAAGRSFEDFGSITRHSYVPEEALLWTAGCAQEMVLGGRETTEVFGFQATPPGPLPFPALRE